MDEVEDVSDDESAVNSSKECNLFSKNETSITAQKNQMADHPEPVKVAAALEDVGDQQQEQESDIGEFNPLEGIGGCGESFSDGDRSSIGDSPFWTQTIAPGKYYKRTRNGGQTCTPALRSLQQEFEQKILLPIKAQKAAQPRSEPPKLADFHTCTSCTNSHHLSSEASSESDSDCDSSCPPSPQNKNGEGTGTSCEKEKSSKDRPGKQSLSQKEIVRKRGHPAALHQDVGFNEPGQLNDGPLCKCSWTAKQTGIRHDKFAGEKPIPRCDWDESNADRLHHYVLSVEPSPGQFSRQATSVQHDGHTYEFDGFSLLLHRQLPDQFPQEPINQWTNDFRVRLVKENIPESFTIRDLELFHAFLFEHVLEFYDLNRLPNLKRTEEEEGTSCFVYHCLPRFARLLPDDGKELLPMSAVLAHFVKSFSPLVDEQMAHSFCRDPGSQTKFAIENKGKVCLNPNKRPCALRVDLIEPPSVVPGNTDFFPMLTHFGIKPSAYTFQKKPQYQEALKKHIRLRKSFYASGNFISPSDKRILRESEANLLVLKQQSMTRKDSTVHVSSRDFYSTGLYPDVVQHALLLVLMCQHIRFHCSLEVLEGERIGYSFKNRALLELALIHPSFRANYGMNPDHAKNTLNNCGLRRTSRRGGERSNRNGIGSSHLTPASTCPMASGRKKGIYALMEIMSRQGNENVAESPLRHNERLEFLGDAVVEFLTTVHLFFLFTNLDEGGLATFRSALVQNRHLATLADHLGLQQFMVYAHGPDLCHEADLRHAMANAFEALMAALFLDANLEECDRIYSRVIFQGEPQLGEIWTKLPEHPLKRDNPHGDRHLIESVPCLKLIAQFEETIGIRFKHIRLLAKAFTRRNVPYNYLTLGNNQRLEFLGDTVLQLLTTEYLYKHFPHHQEGHLSLLRTCLVSNKTQSVVCDELEMAKYLIIPQNNRGALAQLRLKDKADLNEAFLGALFVDRGLLYCRQFCRVCFFPRLKYFIVNQQWNDPKSQLQQCCLALRDGASNPDIPEYKTIGVEGPTNTRVYRVAVYFRKKRLAEGTGHSVHQAQMQAARNALIQHADHFPTMNNSQKTTPAQREKQTKNGKERGPTEISIRNNRPTNGGRRHAPEWKNGGEGGFVTPKFSSNMRQPDERKRGLKRAWSSEKNGEARRPDDSVQNGQISANGEREMPPKRKPHLTDKEYWSPRLKAIQQAMLKSQQQNDAGPSTSQLTPANPWKRPKFDRNNKQISPQKAATTSQNSNRSNVSAKRINNGSYLSLLPPPPPPPPPPFLSSKQISDKPSNPNEELLLPPPPPPPKIS